MINHPARRQFAPGADAALLESFTPGLGLIRPELRELLDPWDPDIEYVLDSLGLMKLAGCEVEDPDVFAMAIEAGHRRAAREHDDPVGRAKQRRAYEARVAESNARFAAQRESKAQVYYARLGNRVKIGFSFDVKRRMISIQPEELMATEPGGIQKEAKRHAEFADLRVAGEWFRYEGRLVDHIAVLKQLKS
jgi:hypothetical protein